MDIKAHGIAFYTEADRCSSGNMSPIKMKDGYDYIWIFSEMGGDSLNPQLRIALRQGWDFMICDEEEYEGLSKVRCENLNYKGEVCYNFTDSGKYNGLEIVARLAFRESEFSWASVSKGETNG